MAKKTLRQKALLYEVARELFVGELEAPQERLHVSGKNRAAPPQVQKSKKLPLEGG